MEKVRSRIDRHAGARLRCFVIRTGWVALLAGSGSLEAQMSEPSLSQEVFAGTGVEDYLRTLQARGLVPAYPWSLRGFSQPEIDRLLPDSVLVHPWSGDLHRGSGRASGLRPKIVAPRLQLIYNSSFPYGSNDGPIWAGRGLTSALQAGLAARYGPLSLVLAPLVFRSENRPFELESGLNAGPWSRYSDAADPGSIDLPQRFGDRAYARIEPGQSTLRLDLPIVALGVSTANQYWGPATDHPMLLGNNAAGFLHGFVGTSRPQSVGIGRVHGRLVWGRLEQSAFSPMPDSIGRRFMTGAVAVFLPRGVPGLELGATRFFHNVWPRDGLRAVDFAQPFESILKIGLRSNESQPDTANDEVRKSAPDNQLASVFARWVFPKSGLDVYGEFAREDHNYDFRDFVLELTHNAGYMMGVRKSWSTSPSRIVSSRAEVMNALPGHTTLARDVGQSPFYRHASTRQGHTERGQILGSAAGYGGAATLLGVDYYHPRGAWTLEWSRAVVAERSADLTVGTMFGEKGIDVLHSISAERLLFLTDFDLAVGLTGAYEINRDFRDDAMNLNVSLGIRARP